jgi:hypothetical protein
VNHLRTIAVSTLLLGCGDSATGREEVATETEASGGGASTGAASDDDAADGTTSAADGSDSDSSGGEPPILPACAAGDVPTPSGLSFDGVDDHVTMGVAPSLGLQTFTLEAWVRRDGAGETAGTGAGGVQLVPIISKGRGENDDTIYNCNYAFGFNGNVLAADFEDMASGENHPVVGTIPVTWGQWHHVAATYDGSDWRLYVDGQLDVQVAAGATPRSDSVQHFAIGTAMDSTGAAAGRFAGAIDEVRVWNQARSGPDISALMSETVAAGEGLVARWALDEQDAGAPDTLGAVDGTIEGAAFGNGAVLDVGRPPEVIPVEPVDAAVRNADAVELAVVIGDPDDEDFVATFHVREVSEFDDFTIVVLPDTQYYSDVDAPQGGSPDYFHDQTQWVRDHREEYGIVAVIHNGDLVNNGDEPAEWVIANAAMARLETPEDDLPEGVPYGVCVGNHDQDERGVDGAVSAFNTHFGVDRFAGRGYYGGHYGDGNEENWISFQAGGLEFIVVNLQYDETPDPAVLRWARTVFEAHPDAFGVLNTHFILGSGGGFGPQGQAIYDELRATDNVQLMTCGHVSAESRRSDTYQGNVIHSMLADYQGDGDGGSGYMRIWEFSPANDQLTVRTYSPSLDNWLTSDASEFTIDVELPGAGQAFEDVATLDPAGSLATTTVEGLLPGRTYEWYATVSDCAHAVNTPVVRFTTQP